MQPLDSALSLEELLKRGQSMEEEGNFEDAVNVYHQVIAQAPNSVQAYVKLGDAFFQLKKFENATENYKKVIELQPDLARPYFRMGQIESKNKNWDVSIGYFKKAIARNSKNPWFYSGIGESYFNSDQLDEAESSFLKATELKHDIPSMHNRLGVIFYRKKQLNKAISSFESLLKLNPNHLGANQTLGDIYTQKKTFKQAAAYYQKAVELKSDNPSTHAKLARALRRNGQLEQAIGAWSTAILLKADRYQFHEQLGDVLLEQGDRDGAIASYEKAIALNPELPRLQEKLNMLLQRPTPTPESVTASETPDLAVTETQIVEEEGVRTEIEEKEVSTPINGTVDAPLLDEISETSSLKPDEQPDFDTNQLAEESIKSVQAISTDETTPPNLAQAQSHKLIKGQHQSEAQLSGEQHQTLRTHEKISEKAEEIFTSNHDIAEDKRGDLQEVPIAVKLNQEIKHGKGAGASGKASFGNHKRRGVRNIATDSTGINKDFSFSAEGVGSYDESIPSPVKKIVLFLLLGFYGAIALALILKGLKVLGIFLLVIAALILLVFWIFRKSLKKF